MDAKDGPGRGRLTVGPGVAEGVNPALATSNKGFHEHTLRCFVIIPSLLLSFFLSRDDHETRLACGDAHFPDDYPQVKRPFLHSSRAEQPPGAVAPIDSVRRELRLRVLGWQREMRQSAVSWNLLACVGRSSSVRVGVVCAGIAVAAGLSSLAGCGSSRPTASPIPLRATTTTDVQVPTPVRVPARFVGSWYVHDSVLQISDDGVGTQTNSGASEAAIDTLAFIADSGGMTLNGTIRSIRYLVNGIPAPDPDPADAQQPGDTFTLTWINQHLLKSAFLKTSLPQIDVTGSNPHWCGGGPGPWQQVLGRTPASDQDRCFGP